MLRSISLFTGAGGLDLGLHVAGISPSVAIEMDPHAIATLEAEENKKWWRECSVIHGRLEDIASEDILTSGCLEKGQVDLLVGGPPCQPFSKSGYWHSGDAKRLSDPRANTLREYLRVLEDAKPRVFLLENVPGLAFSEKDEGLSYLRDAITQINKRQNTKYSICARQLNAVQFGIPQARERVFVIGHRDGREFEFPRATHFEPPRTDMAGNPNRTRDTAKLADRTAGLRRFTTAWDAIGHLSRKHDPELRVRGKWAGLLPSIPEGHNYLFHTSRGGGVPIFGWRRRYWSMLLKLAKDRPSWTLTAQPGPAIGPFHWENRRLTSEELCALQTFPQGYHIVGGVMAAHKQVGNAVPSALAELLGLEIRRQFFDHRAANAEVSLLPRTKGDPPPPEQIMPVPEAYLCLVGDHEEHPGTGRGPGAMRRIVGVE